jgi:hypothetical protein
MRFYDPPANRQPQPGSGHLAGPLHAIKLVEHTLQVFARDADATVGDFDERL